MENRSLKLDLIALALLAIVIFLALAMLTYTPADPIVDLVAPLDRIYQPDLLVYPQNTDVQNACGKWGALTTGLLLTGFGVGAYYLILSLAILDALLLMRREIDAPIVRLIGWSVSLIGITSLVAITAPGFSPGPVIGSGGYLGALGAGLLEMHFATIGGLIFATSLIAGGLLLCTDYALIQITHAVMRAVLTGVTGRRSRPRVPRSTTKQQSGVSIRVGGRSVDETSDEEEDNEEDEEDVEEDEQDLEAEVSESDEQAVVVRQSTKKDRSDKANDAKGPRVRRRGQKKESRQEVIQSLDEASLSQNPEDYELPKLDLLIPADDVCFEEQAKEVRQKAKILERTFANFGFNVKVVEIETGPVIAQYEVELEAGLRLSRITGLADDLAIALRVPSVRIVAPIPGKNTVGIEVPNKARQIVRLREIMEESRAKTKKMRIPIFLGKDVSGNPLTVDLSTLPHLLIAGRTGTGKSVCLNAIISSILMTRRPDEVRMLMIDPKMVELSGYARLPHLMHPVVTDMRKAEAILAWAVEKMEERYSLLARAGVRHITSYNQLGKEELIERLQPETDEQRDSIPEHLPFIVIVADEIADLMMTSGKEVEQHIIRLAQKSRAIGIHLILATQKPTVDVITGLIKSNLPARIAFQVASRTDSRVVLDEMGADKLLGNGDMLFLWPGTSMLLRGQGTYLTDDEISSVVDTVSTGEQNFVNELVTINVDEPDAADGPAQLRKRDELYESAIDVIVREGRGSVSLLQRTLGIGYGRAARLIDFMAEDGFVGEYNGSQAREVLLGTADWERMQGIESEPESTPKEPTRRSNVIRPDQWDDTDTEDEAGKQANLDESVDQHHPFALDQDADSDDETYEDDDQDENEEQEDEEEEYEDEVDEYEEELEEDEEEVGEYEDGDEYAEEDDEALEDEEDEVPVEQTPVRRARKRGRFNSV